MEQSNNYSDYQLLPPIIRKHFTATAFIIDSQKRTLLLWHRRLQRWMPPGGHVDPDETPEDTARRECKEETGLDVEIIGEPQEDMFEGNRSEGQMLRKPIALLLENIPACPERNEGEHQHMDFVYLARPVDEGQMIELAEEEGDEIRWFSKENIGALDDSTEIFANVKHYVLSVLR